MRTGTELDCKTVVFGCVRKARSAVSAILECEAREPHHSPSPFFHSLQTFRSNMIPSLAFAKNTAVLQSRYWVTLSDYNRRLLLYFSFPSSTNLFLRYVFFIFCLARRRSKLTYARSVSLSAPVSRFSRQLKKAVMPRRRFIYTVI